MIGIAPALGVNQDTLAGLQHSAVYNHSEKKDQYRFLTPGRIALSGLAMLGFYLACSRTPLTRGFFGSLPRILERHGMGNRAAAIRRFEPVWERNVKHSQGGAISNLITALAVEGMLQHEATDSQWDPVGFAGFHFITYFANIMALSVSGTKLFGLCSAPWRGRKAWVPTEFPWHKGREYLQILKPGRGLPAMDRVKLAATIPHFVWQSFAMGIFISLSVFVGRVAYENIRGGRERFDSNSGPDALRDSLAYSFNKKVRDIEPKDRQEVRYDYISDSFWSNLKWGWTRRIVSLMFFKPGTFWFGLFGDLLYVPYEYYFVFRNDVHKGK